MGSSMDRDPLASQHTHTVINSYLTIIECGTYVYCLLSVVYTLQTVPCILLHTLPMPLTVYCIAYMYIMLMNVRLVLLSSCNHTLVHTDVKLHTSSGGGFIGNW